PKSSGPKALWNPAEVDALIKYLHHHCFEAGDNGNFKSNLYTSAAMHISEFLTEGLPKTRDMVKNKWVSHIQRIYHDIEGYCLKSGCHWDNTCGAGVQGMFDEQVFDDCVKVFYPSNIFINSGWQYYNLVADIIPNSGAHGTNAFTPSTSQIATGS
ncbi:hypothetical protein M404DRAFT_111114, partial [Pisolithus tinctorius Marx 270]